MKLKSKTLTVKISIDRDKPYTRASVGNCEMKCPLGKCGLRFEMSGLETDGGTISPTICVGSVKGDE